MGTSYIRVMPLSSCISASCAGPSFGVSCIAVPCISALCAGPSFGFSQAVSSSAGTSELTTIGSGELEGTSIRLLVLVADGAAGIECGGDTDVQPINERLEKSRNDSCHKKSHFEFRNEDRRGQKATQRIGGSTYIPGGHL
jgi:hypothetical protein